MENYNASSNDEGDGRLRIGARSLDDDSAYHFSQTEEDLLILQRESGDDKAFTLLQIKAPLVEGDQESTLGLMRHFGNKMELLEFYNNGYSDETQHGIRISSFGTGKIQPFVVDQQMNGGAKKKVFEIKPDGETTFSTQTNFLSGIRAKSRVLKTTASNIVPDINKYDSIVLTCKREITIAAPSGNPTDFQSLKMRILDNGRPLQINWNAVYKAYTRIIPTQTKVFFIEFVYSEQDGFWYCVK